MPNSGVARTSNISVASGQTPADVNFSLTAAPTTGAVTGTVTSASGGPTISGATVADSGRVASTTTGPGAYTLSGLAPGSHTLTASATSYTSQSVTTSVTASQTTQRVNFSLTPTPSGAPQLVQAAGGTEIGASTSVAATFPTPTSGGHLLVLSASAYTGTSNNISSVTDSGGNAWTRIGVFFLPGHHSDGEMWYSANARAVTSVTAHTPKPAVVSLEVNEFSGVASTMPLDCSTGNVGISTSAGSGSVTPHSTNELVAGFVAGHSKPQAISITALGYKAQAQQTSRSTGNAVASVVSGYTVLTSASAQTLTASFASSMYWAVGIACFKAAP